MPYSVYAFRSADLGKVPGPEVFWMSRFSEVLSLQTNIGVVVGDGRTVLINTGPPLDYLNYMNSVWREELGEQSQITVSEEDHVVSSLSKLGLKPGDIDHVVITPLQAYAIGNIRLFENADICVSRTGWIDLLAPRHFDPRRKMAVPDDILSYLLFDAWPSKRVRLLEDEDQIAPGIRTWWAGTHHRSSIAIEVDTEDGVVTFSDVVFYYDNLEMNHPLGIAESIEECKDAYARIRKDTKHFVSLYDPRLFERYPGGKVFESR